MRRLFRLLLASLPVAALFACGDSGPKSGALLEGGAGGTSGDGTYCGEKIGSVRARTNVFFVVDRSGSMSIPISAMDKRTRYEVLREALVKLARAVGPTTNIGAAVYPSADKACGPGAPVMNISPGDSMDYITTNTFGPTAKAFDAAINVPTTGSTPTGPTLQALKAKLKSFGPNTFVLLATDGGPNCSETPPPKCDISECTLNIDKANMVCTPKFNCCDPANGPEYSSGFCLDNAGAETAAKELLADGIKTIVVGIPGTENYSLLLDNMAVAGGFPNTMGNHKYFSAGSVDELSAVFTQIAASLPVQCAVVLYGVPSDPNQVNLYFDGKVVPASATDGWTYAADGKTLDLHGSSCDAMKTNAVQQVFATFGCPTVTTSK